MNQRGFLIGLLAGAWIATLLVLLLPGLGLHLAQAEDPPTSTPRQPGGPNGPQLPGPTINPIDGPQRTTGVPNPGLGTSDSNNRAIALSATIGSGQSVVYYFDTVAQRLCVYQYTGGSRGGLKLLAARLIGYDLRLEQYKDLSDMSPREMREAYEAAMGVEDAPSRERGPGTRHVDLPGGFR